MGYFQGHHVMVLTSSQFIAILQLKREKHTDYIFLDTNILCQPIIEILKANKIEFITSYTRCGFTLSFPQLNVFTSELNYIHYRPIHKILWKFQREHVSKSYEHPNILC